MPRKLTKSKTKTPRVSVDDISSINYKDFLEINMREYGKYVVENRAIPDIHDGLKPVQRRILWAAYSMGAKFSGGTYKTARVSGDCMGKYHPHGNAAIEDSIANMIEGAYCPLLVGQGNFGSYTKEAPPAAARYTECKLNKLAEECLLDPYYLKVIPMLPNYDGKEVEPIYLPAKLPMILATGGSGVAVGVTTNIPAYTVESLKEAVLYMLENKSNYKNKEKLAKILKFATIYGGEVAGDNQDQLNVFTSKEPAPLVWANDYKIVDDYTLVITGFYPEWNFDSKWNRIREMPEVASAVDLSKKKIHLEITLKKNADTDSVFAKLEDMNIGTVTYRSNVIVRSLDSSKEIPEAQSKFSSMSPYEILLFWLKWRLRLEKLALMQEYKELKSKKAHEELLLLACNSLDIIFKLLKSKGINKVDELAKRLKITVEESKVIWAMAVGRLDSLSAKEQSIKIKKLKERMRLVKKDFNNPRGAVYRSLSESAFV